MKKEKKQRREMTEKEKKHRKKLLTLVFSCGVLTLTLAVFAILKTSKKVSRFMATKVARGIISVMGRVSSAVPFSLYEMLLYLAGIAIIGGFIAIIIFAVKRKRVYALRIFVSLILAVLVTANVYFVSAGFSYNAYLDCYPTYMGALTKEQVIEFADYFLDDLDNTAKKLERDEKGYVVMPYSMDELSDKLRREYVRLADYGINAYTPACKTITSSGLMSEMGIYGVFFAPFGEANINGYMPVYERPFTMAHEMAHAKGVMREDDANNLAFYITITSSDPFIRYSGLDYGIYTLLDAVWVWEYTEGSFSTPEYRRLCERISPLLKKDWESYWDYKEKYNSLEKLDRIISKINDVYLNLMGQDGGTDAYLPPDTDIVENPVIDPGGNVVIDPGGNVVTQKEPEYNTVQRIFFQAYIEKNGNV